MKKLQRPILAWHFCGDTLRDGRPIPRKGVWLKHEGECVMCVSGLHASRRLIDALVYAPGSTLCRVECVGVVAEQDDKLVCQKRKIIARFDASQLLRRAARKFALDVIHLWPPAPEAWATAWATARDAARNAARDAARDTAWDAARDTAWDAAEAAAWGAAWAAAETTAWGAAWATAWATARDTARDAAWAAQNEWLTREAMQLIFKEQP